MSNNTIVTSTTTFNTPLSSYLHQKQHSLTILRQQLSCLSKKYTSSYSAFSYLAPPLCTTSSLAHTTRPTRQFNRKETDGVWFNQPHTSKVTRHLQHFLSIQKTPSSHKVWKERMANIIKPKPYLKRSPSQKLKSFDYNPSSKNYENNESDIPATDTSYVDTVD